MSQLETNLIIWAICSILLFEILIVICICRCCFNRIKPKRFYVKREEYEYLQGNDGIPSHFQSTILRPPHADELAVVGTIREQNPSIHFDNGIQNYGYYRDNDDDDDDDEILPTISSLPRAPSSPPVNWIELRSPLPPPTTTSLIHTEQLLPAEYEIRSYPTQDYLYTYQPPPLSRPTIIDFQQYPDEYNDDYDDELDDFRIQSLRHSEAISSHMKRTDTSTDTYAGNYSTLIPKSILKGSLSTTPPIDTYPTTSYSQIQHSRTSSKYDESPRMSVKINTDESIAMDYPTSAIERTIPNQSIISSIIPTTNLSSSLTSNRMRFASVSQLNDIEWEVPSEFQTIVYGSNDDRQGYRGVSIYSSNENFNNNNNNNNNHVHESEKLSNRKRSQSAGVDQRTHVSRIFVPWDQEKKIFQPLYLGNGIGQGDTTQQQAFEY